MYPVADLQPQDLYNAILVMANSCLRVGELRALKWGDLDENSNLSKEDQKVGHLIRIRKEATKTGEPRTVQSPTKKYFDEIRKSLLGFLRSRGHVSLM